MTTINWSVDNKKQFEAGVDRGVLYVGNAEGVPWFGLVAVRERKTGGEAKPIYYDGVKVNNYSNLTEFEGVIEAFTYPTEFDACEGIVKTDMGFIADNQRPKMFGLSYRTGLANGDEGIDYGYRVHIVFNILVEPTERNHQTIAEQLDPSNFVWNFTTTPKTFDSLSPTAHISFDTEQNTYFALRQLELILYGTDDTAARLPYVYELEEIPWNDRAIFATTYPDIPKYAGLGDIVFASSTLTAYKVGSTASNQVRKVISKTSAEAMPSTAMVGDIVYETDTDNLYEIGAL